MPCEGEIAKNRERAARRAKKRIRHACKSVRFDRMLTLTTRDAIFDRDEFQRMIEKFIRLVRKASGDALPYVLTVEKHDSKKLAKQSVVRSMRTWLCEAVRITSCFNQFGIIVFVVVAG